MPLTSRIAPLYFSLAAALAASSADNRAAEIWITFSSRALIMGSTSSSFAGAASLATTLFVGADLSFVLAAVFGLSGVVFALSFAATVGELFIADAVFLSADGVMVFTTPLLLDAFAVVVSFVVRLR